MGVRIALEELYRRMAKLASHPALNRKATGSIPVAPAVAVAQLAVQRIVDPPVVGSNPIGHRSVKGIGIYDETKKRCIV